MNTTITLDMLRKAGAGAEQRTLFTRRYGDSVTVTVEEAIAVAGMFDWTWAAGAFFPRQGIDAYHAAVKTAREAYNTAMKTANKAYDEAVKTAREVYDAVRARAFAETALTYGLIEMD